MRAIFAEKQENVHSMLQKGCGHREIARILNVSMENMHNIRKTHLSNINCSCRGRLRLLNIEIEWSCTLQEMIERACTIPNITKHVEQDFEILVSAQNVRYAFKRSSYCLH